MSQVNMDATVLSDGDDVDKRFKDGMTPLMKACQRLQRAKVQQLLRRGANPNLKCRKTGNTPLHFVSGRKMCKNMLDFPANLPADIENRVCIMEMLLAHGGILKNNKDGLSPLCLGAMCGFHDIVKFFEAVHNVDNSVKNLDFAKAYKLLGVSYTIFLDEERAADYADLAESCFQKADELEKMTNVRPDRESQDNEFEKCFIREECKERSANLYVKGMIAAVKLLPLNLKKELVWENVLNFAERAMFESEHYGVETGCRLCQYLINREIDGSSKFGAVLSRLSMIICDSMVLPFKVVQNVAIVLQHFASKCHKRGTYTLRMQCLQIFSSIGNIITEISCYQRKFSHLELLLPPTIMITKKIYNAFNHCRYDLRPEDLSIVREVLNHLENVMDIDFRGYDMARGMSNRLIYLIFTLLPHDLCCCKNYRSGDWLQPSGNLIHLVVSRFICPQFIGNGRSFPEVTISFLTKLTRLLVRHGCRLTEVNKSGRTPKELFIKSCQKCNIDPAAPGLQSLHKLLTPDASPLSLEELATRVILKNRISYKNHVPKILSDFIEGGCMVDDLSELDSPDNSDGEE